MSTTYSLQLYMVKGFLCEPARLLCCSAKCFFP